ncbi:selenocysteine-specific translation elongation factor [bacterium]|nr:selenocysteine-specific translation elongation factor [bacterium]
MKSIIIGTAGHIDHGKTALVKSLTGVDTDRLPEEKARGITIDLGFAHTQWEGIDISFIDVPGHERFIKNMLAGIGGIHLLMLVIAADESVMPQTREHFEICRLLHIPDGVIVITKKDLADNDSLEIVKEEIQSLVQGSPFSNAEVFAVSSKTGEGLDTLKAGLIRKIKEVRTHPGKGVFRLPVDRVFVLKGHGTIVTGTLISGKIRKESGAELMPSRKRVKVRSIHAHDKNVEEAFSGQRTALNLQGIEKEEIQRGDVLTEADLFVPTSLLDAKISLLPNSNPIRHNALVRFHHLTTDILARITLLGTEVLQPAESGYVQLRLQNSIHALYGDRFILRRHSPLTTIGGGVILDHLPLRRVSAGDASAIERLRILEKGNPEDRLAIAVQMKSMSGADERYLKAKMGMPPQEFAQLHEESVVLLRKNPYLAINRKFELDLTRKMTDTVKSFHEKNPLQFGIPKEELRSRFLKTVPAEVFAAILDRAIDQKLFQIQKDLIAMFGRKVALDQQQESLASRIEEYLQRFGLGTPGLDELAKELKEPIEKTRSLLYLLVREQKAVKIADDYFLHKLAWEDLKQKIRNLKTTQKTFSVPDFKALFGITRKFAIPLLENLDREGITRRAGNERIIL